MRQPSSEIVASLYRALLRREPDDSGAAHFSGLLEAQGLQRVVRDLLESVEFREKNTDYTELFRPNYCSGMQVDLAASEQQMNEIWRCTERAWTEMGNTDPFFSVITDPRFHDADGTDAVLVNEFHESGKDDVRYFDAFLRRAGLADRRFARAVEYGCGAGRVSRWLAPLTERLTCLDISRPLMDLGKRHLAASGIGNVDFFLVSSREDLARLHDIDLFFTMIVLQHNPPPIIMDILDQAFAGLRRDGLAFFQVPTYRDDYHFNVEDYIASLDGTGPLMEMHFVPQQAIFDAAEKRGMSTIEVRTDHRIGMYGRGVSNTFLMRKS